MTNCSHCFSISLYTNTYTLTCSLTAWMIKRSCLVEYDTLFTLFWYLFLYKYIYTDLLPDSVNDKKELFGGAWHTVHTVLVPLSTQIHTHWPAPWQREWQKGAVWWSMTHGSHCFSISLYTNMYIILTCSLTASMINRSCLVECDTLFTLFWFLLCDLLPDWVNHELELFSRVWHTVHTVLVSPSTQICIYWPAPSQCQW